MQGLAAHAPAALARLAPQARVDLELHLFANIVTLLCYVRPHMTLRLHNNPTSFYFLVSRPSFRSSPSSTKILSVAALHSPLPRSDVACLRSNTSPHLACDSIPPVTQFSVILLRPLALSRVGPCRANRQAARSSLLGRSLLSHRCCRWSASRCPFWSPSPSPPSP